MQIACSSDLAKMFQVTKYFIKQANLYKALTDIYRKRNSFFVCLLNACFSCNKRDELDILFHSVKMNFHDTFTETWDNQTYEPHWPSGLYYFLFLNRSTKRGGGLS